MFSSFKIENLEYICTCYSKRGLKGYRCESGIQFNLNGGSLVDSFIKEKLIKSSPDPDRPMSTLPQDVSDSDLGIYLVLLYLSTLPTQPLINCTDMFRIPQFLFEIKRSRKLRLSLFRNNLYTVMDIMNQLSRSGL